jgi:RNA polymerase sigma-70 factor (ECF subfamily)
MTVSAECMVQRSALSHEGASVTDVSDEALMSQVSNGNGAAYAALINRHFDRMLRVAQRTIGNREDAEDIAQDVCIRIWTHAKVWEPGRAKFTTWSYRMLMNRCIDFHRRLRGEALDVVEEREDPSPDVTEVLYRSQMANHVATAMAELPANQRAAIALCYYEEMSNSEAAEILSTTVGAVESLLVRGRCRLREILRDRLDRNESSVEGGCHDH